MKLIIADDEKWVRATVKTLIPFEKLGITLASEATNGIEALELCRLHEPDILLTDIMMPGLTGLELIRELRSLLPQLKIVIISGYSDFEYAKTAMKYGIKDYLLKPVEESELVQVLERIVAEFGEQARLLEAKESEEEQYKKALPVMREAFLNQLISPNSMTADNIRSECQKYGILLTAGSFSVCVISPDDTVLKGDRNKGDYYRLLITRVMKRYASAVTFPVAHDKTTLVSILNSENGTEGTGRAFRIGNRLLHKRLGLSISAGVSNPTRQLCMLPELYAKACEVLEARFWEGSGILAFHRPGYLTDDVKLSLSEDTLNKIILNFKLSNLQTALSYVSSVSESLYLNRNIKPAFVREFFWQFIQSVMILLNIQLPFIRHETMVTGEQPYERIKGTLFMSDLESCVKVLLEHIFNFYHDKNPMDNINLIENAKKIIESNFAGDLSLEQVAKHVHLSPAYLSELFKKETGMSFIDYKTIIRIEYAKKLLCASSMNISEVSGRVGYSDPKYFSKLFKKITGKTIYEYKKECRNIT